MCGSSTTTYGGWFVNPVRRVLPLRITCAGQTFNYGKKILGRARRGLAGRPATIRPSPGVPANLQAAARFHDAVARIRDELQSGLLMPIYGRRGAQKIPQMGANFIRSQGCNTPLNGPVFDSYRRQNFAGDFGRECGRLADFILGIWSSKCHTMVSKGPNAVQRHC